MLSTNFKADLCALLITVWHERFPYKDAPFNLKHFRERRPRNFRNFDNFKIQNFQIDLSVCTMYVDLYLYGNYMVIHHFYDKTSSSVGGFA